LARCRDEWRRYWRPLEELDDQREHSDKKERSIVLYGVPEAERGLSPSLRQAHTEKVISSILDALDMSKSTGWVESCRISFRNSIWGHRLRAIEPYKGIFIRKSMSIDERKKDRDLRINARELNLKEFEGERVYVVYRGDIVKVSDIPLT
ncbi:hypothetical protein COOONC_21466, partial [Cooperia oncophora]